ncbi:MAG: serine/threonine protein kinase [Pyrinomonadaceae bacterium]
MSEKQELPIMERARWQQLNDIFSDALGLDPEKQSEFLKQSCGGDAALHREAMAMLAATRAADSRGFLAADVFADGARVLANNEVAPGTEIGGYRVVREIGRGGMGAVYLALRKGFYQQVALKIIKRGMDTDQIIRRFVRERDVLASLNHPNIARLLDGGHTTDGLPFIAMEYVEGESITAFCDRKKLTIDDRIVLFRKVCAAVAYAHHNLVVHRDIKPSNILIAPDGEPKLLDFGIAKLLVPDASGNTIDLTVAGANLMTPDYASPEQIRGDRVTTVSDIYSLGVLLYELLCGRRPFRFKDRQSAEILKIVSEQEPSAPSTAALTKAEDVPEGHTKRNPISRNCCCFAQRTTRTASQTVAWGLGQYCFNGTEKRSATSLQFGGTIFRGLAETFIGTSRGGASRHARLSGRQIRAKKSNCGGVCWSRFNRLTGRLIDCYLASTRCSRRTHACGAARYGNAPPG